MATLNNLNQGGLWGGGLTGGGALDGLPSTGGSPQNANQSNWEARTQQPQNVFATPGQLQGMGATAIPNNNYNNLNQSATSTITPLGGANNNNSTPSPTGSNNLWGNQNPFMPSVTSTSMDGSTTNFASPGNPNVNYATQDAAKQIAQRYGGNVVSSGNVMGGSVSDPMYGIDFGAGDPIGAGQIAFWEQRGDTPEQIASRLYQAPAWWTNMPGGAGYVNPNIVRNNDVNWNFSKPVATNLPSGQANQGFVNNSNQQSDLWRSVIQNNQARTPSPTGENLPGGGYVDLGTPPTAPTQASNVNAQGMDINSLMQILALALGMNQRQPARPSGNNLMRSYYYPRSEPSY